VLALVEEERLLLDAARREALQEGIQVGDVDSCAEGGRDRVGHEEVGALDHLDQGAAWVLPDWRPATMQRIAASLRWNCRCMSQGR